MIVFVFVCISVLGGRCLTQDIPGKDHTSSQSQIQKLTEDVDFLKSALEQLVLRDQEKDKILTELQSDNAKLLQRVERLEAINANLEQDILHTKKMEVSSKNINTMNSTEKSHGVVHSKDDGQSVLPVEGASYRQNKWIKTSSKRLLEGDVQRRVAFSARFADYKHALNLGQTVVFDYVYTNIGGRYNSHSGMFTVDTAGVYVFFVNIICAPHEGVYTELVKDGSAVSLQYCEGDDQYENGSNMVVVELPVGVSMWVRTRHVEHNDVFELSTETTFSGFLLYEN